MTWITANFPNLTEQAKKRVVAGTTTRLGGVSQGAYVGLNLATHVTDELIAVTTNRAILRDQLNLPSEPFWLNQTHSTSVIELPYQYRHHPANNKDSVIEADAAYTKLANHVCTVMTADCLPLLIVNSDATEVAAVHAGWRGLANGIVTNTIDSMASNPAELHVWLGPAIGAKAFEVGAEVKAQFVAKNEANMQAFSAVKEDKYLCDIFALARLELEAKGVNYVSGGDHCTVEDKALFYSYRRDGQTGRMASLIWLNND